MTDWEQFWDDEHDGYNLSLMSDVEILGLADGYDDGRIDAVIHAYLDLREQVKDAADK